MARRFRRKSGAKRYRRRRYSRRGRRLRRIVVSLSRKMAAEVKKADNNILLPQSSFVPITPQNADSTSPSLSDWGALYPIFGNEAFTQGLNLDDFIGEQIRAKYLYIGLHLQQINTAALYATPGTEGTSGNALNSMFPITLRCMLIQDRNYNNLQAATGETGTNIVSAQSMIYNIFGIDPDTAFQQTDAYNNALDVTLLPINPHEPGRFNVIRDFKMNTAPGWRADYYKKLMILQKDLNSKGRIYFANNPATGNAGDYPPGNNPSQRFVARNNLYLLFLWQYPYLTGGTTSTITRPIFNLSVQTRFAYYDN